MAEERNRRNAFRFTDIQRLAIKIGDEMVQNIRSNVTEFKKRRAEEMKAESSAEKVNKEMLELLEWLDCRGGLGYDVHGRIRTVIAKAKEQNEDPNNGL